MNLQWSKDMGRSIDYLETRPDIDTRKLAYFGISFGAAAAVRLVAVETTVQGGDSPFGRFLGKGSSRGRPVELRAAFQSART